MRSMTNEATKLIKLGRTIAKHLKQKHFSQNVFAETLNTSREHLAKIETAKRKPSLSLIF